MTFFELSLRKYNYLSFNRVFEDMRSESLDFYSVCFGPFTKEVASFDVELSTLHQDEIRPIFQYKQWESEVLNNGVGGEEAIVNEVKHWQVVTNASGQQEYYLVLKLYKLD